MRAGSNSGPDIGAAVTADRADEAWLDTRLAHAGGTQFAEGDLLRVGHVRQPSRGSSFVT